jgi:aminobenzoyl-glutamate transport protein
VAFELIAIVAALLLLTAIPHAPLLSATGVLFPSSFSDGLLPVVCFVVIVVSLSYGFVSEKFTSFEMLLDALVRGIRKASPLLLLYVLAAELYASLRFVF